MFSQSLECLWKCFLLSWLNNRYEHCLSLSESGSSFFLMENPFLAQFRAMIVEPPLRLPCEHQWWRKIEGCR